MITYKQQVQIVYNIYNSFKKGEVITQFVTNDEFKYSKLYYDPVKFEAMTATNFKILVILSVYNKEPVGVVNLLQILNAYTKKEREAGTQMKSDIRAYDHIIETDMLTLESLNITPYVAYHDKNLIHLFTFAKYYKEHPKEIKGVMLTKYAKKAMLVVNYFGLED